MQRIGNKLSANFDFLRKCLTLIIFRMFFCFYSRTLKNLRIYEMFEFIDNEVLVLHFDTLMYDIKCSIKIFKSALKARQQMRLSIYRKLITNIDELLSRAIKLRRQFNYFNVHLYSRVIRDGGEDCTVHSFTRPLTQVVARLEEYRRKINRRYFSRNGNQ